MDNVLNDLETLEKLLEKLTNAFNRDFNSVELNEKNKQLAEIEKAMANLEKANIPIPEEFRKLKLSLYQEVNQYNDFFRLKENYEKLLKDNYNKISYKIISPKPQKPPTFPSGGKRTRKFIKITQKDLLDENIIPAGLMIYKTFRGKYYTAIIRGDGIIEVVLNNKTHEFRSLSTAAEYITKGSINGWDWWLTDFEKAERPMSYYRNKLR